MHDNIDSYVGTILIRLLIGILVYLKTYDRISRVKGLIYYSAHQRMGTISIHRHISKYVDKFLEVSK